MAEPVIDVSSVTIFPKFSPCAVYGCITAYDNLDLSLPTYDLYNRDPEHAELIVEPGQALSVIDIEKILHMQQPVMFLSLKVKDTYSNIKDDAFIASGTVHLDIATHNDYEEVKQAVVDGDFGHATVNYIALSCAFLYKIRIALEDDWMSVASERDSNYLKCSLHGTIVAHYGRTFGCTDNYRIPLLNVPSDQTIPLYLDGSLPCMELTRNYVAVPAYSSLNIKANLWLAGSNMKVVEEEDTIVLWAQNWRGSSDLERKRYLLPEPRQKVFCIPGRWREMLHLEPSSRRTSRKSGFFEGNYVLEVFSVFIGRHNDHDLSLSGSITLDYEDMKIDIFNRDDSNPDQLMNGRKLLTITWPDCLECSVLVDFTMTVKIKDADDRFCIQEGQVDYMTTYRVGWHYDSEFDRPLCSVIPGDNDNGYFAVHYTVFNSAASLSLKIVLLCKGGVDVVANVRGKIVAWSDIFDYSKEYDKKYYRRVLYDKPNDQIYYPQKTTKGSSLDEDKHGVVELSESCSVAVPLAFSFNICVDLYANSHTRSDPAEHLHKTFSFMYDEKKQTKMKLEIPGGDFELLMQEL